MLQGEQSEPDWQDAGAYAPLLEADRSIFAWEWLRRNRRYRAAALGSISGGGPETRPEEWGLHAFEMPWQAAPQARPVWHAAIHPYVLKTEAKSPVAAADTFDLAQVLEASTLIRDSDGSEHLLLSDGMRAIRIDVLVGSLTSGPVQLSYILSGLRSAVKPLETLSRLFALYRSRRFSRILHVPEARAKRWSLMLRTYDALAAGADQRDIAAILLNAAAGEPRWRTETPSVRSQVQRLVRGARVFAAGGYLELLR